MNIPPKCAGRVNNKQTITGRIRALAPGEFIEVPRKQEAAFYKSAAQSGIRIAARRAGAIETTRIYRLEDTQ